jgi:hypothetical protein
LPPEQVFVIFSTAAARRAHPGRTDTRRCEGGLPVDSISSSNRLSALDRAILTEKQRTASILEVALRLLLEEETVRQRLRRIAKVLEDDAAAEGAAAGPAQARPASVA